MRCDEVKQQLKAFSAGELPAPVHRAVQAHVARCASCRAELLRLDALAGVLAGTQTPPVPPGFASRVLASARRRRQAEPVPAWDLLGWWRLASAPIRAAAAAVLIIGVIIGLAMGWAAAPSAGQTSTAARADPLDAYQFDYLGEAPEGSLADSYLTLVSATDEGGR